MSMEPVFPKSDKNQFCVFFFFIWSILIFIQNQEKKREFLLHIFFYHFEIINIK